MLTMHDFLVASCTFVARGEATVTLVCNVDMTMYVYFNKIDIDLSHATLVTNKPLTRGNKPSKNGKGHNRLCTT